MNNKNISRVAVESWITVDRAKQLFTGRRTGF